MLIEAYHSLKLSMEFLILRANDAASLDCLWRRAAWDMSKTNKRFGIDYNLT